MSHAEKSDSKPSVRAEVEVLLSCARTRVNPQKAARIEELLREPFDWEMLLRLAHRHKLEPLLYWQLKAICPQAVPTVHLEHLRKRFSQNTARNIFLSTELRNILELFETKGIEAIPYKGPVLAATAYGNPALRLYSDLDLLIHSRDFAEATELLISRGYSPEYDLKNTRQAAYVQAKGELLFEQANSRLFVEIHWAVTPDYLSRKLNSAGFWNRLHKIEFNGASVLSFSPEDLLLILCVHAGKHLWERLAWVCDIAELINSQNEIDWQLLSGRADETGVRRMLNLGLFLAHDLLETNLPQKLLNELQTDPAIQTLARRVRHRLFADTISPIGPAELFRYHFKVRENFFDAARYCYNIMIPPTPAELEALSIPDSLSFLYYPLRPVRLIKKHGMRKLKKLARTKAG